MFNSKILCAAIPDLMATVMGDVAASMKVPADKNAVYDNMMEEVALAVRMADVDFAAIAAYEAVNGKGYDLLPIAYYSSLSAGEMLTKEEYEAQIDQLVELAKKISGVLNKSLSGDNKAFTDSVAAHIVENVKNGGQDAAATLDAQTVAGVISGIDSTALEGDADKLLPQLTDKEKFETDVVTVDIIANAIRETVRAAVADESKAKETASTLASVVSDFAGAVSNATDAEGNLDMTKLDFTKIGDAITTLQNSPLKGVGTCVLDMVAAADAGGMLGNVMQAVKDGYEKGEDVGGTIGSAGALINLGNAMGGENDQEAMVNSLTDLIKNLNEFTISLLPTIFSEETVTSMGIPTEYATATYKVFETLLTELMKLKDAADYDSEVNAILELYNLATSGTDNFTEENLKNLFGYANKSDAIYNTLVGISTSDPFGMKIEDPAARQELANAIAEVYGDTAKTAKDQSIARALATMLGVDKELKLG
ncbi:MAG: hypothetical protein E7470_00305 [Ruminococcaceae bacterium]|nr:hypothetical protein [Oscillospiraceae bacterium]